MKGPKQWFVLIQTPVRSTGVSYPYALRVIHSGIYPNALPFFEKKRREWEREGCSGHLSKREVMKKLDRIFARLDDMEQVKAENAQTEVLLFIMTGLGVIFLMDIGCRAAATLARK